MEHPDSIAAVEKDPAEIARETVRGVIERLTTSTAGKAVPQHVLRNLIAEEATKALKIPIPRWYQKKDMTAALVDCSDFGWGVIEIGDDSATDRARIAELAVRFKAAPMHVEMQAAILRAHVRQVQIGTQGETGSTNARPCPSRQAIDANWVAWIGDVSGRVLDRLHIAIAIFQQDEGDRGNG